MTAEQVQLSIENSISGIDGIETSTGYTFDKDGLHISKSDSEISTTITEDGMTVYEGSKALLTANNEGVAATDLHAKTYLIIGTNSRFENYGSSRTACFWIGG